jgi:hypothetical protein
MSNKQYSIEEVRGVTGEVCACGARALLRNGDIAAYALSGRSGQLKKWTCERCVSRTAAIALRTRCLGIVE